MSSIVSSHDSGQENAVRNVLNWLLQFDHEIVNLYHSHFEKDYPGPGMHHLRKR